MCGAQVLAALLHCGCDDVAKAVSAELAPLLPAGVTPEAWSEQLVHTTLVKEKQGGGGKGGQKGKGKAKGKQQQQQQQVQQRGQAAPQIPGLHGGKQKVDAAATPKPKSQGQQQLQQQANAQRLESAAGEGGPSAKKRKAKCELTPQSKAGADGEEGSKTGKKSTTKKKKSSS